MKRIVVLMLLLVAAISLVPMMGQAECVPTAAGTACASESGIVLDGDAGNPGPLSGWVTVSSGGQVCSDDNGSPDNSTSPECRP